MSDLPDLSVFATALGERRFIAAVLVAGLSGLVRGFSGFGSALIYIPLVSAIYEPRIAAATLLLIDFVSSTPFSVREFSRCNWREVAPVALAAALMTPVGVLALVFADPIVLRWIISALVLTLLAVLASGWRYHGRPTLPAMAAVGAASGLGSGAVQIAGPPVIIFWLGGRADAITVRANLMVFFVLLSAAACVTYLAQGLVTKDVVVLSLCLGAPYLIAMWFGVRFFHRTSDTTYRRIAYGIVAASALVSVPLFDGLFR
ncbi:MAG TPA: sulfite exporter TauE/SafE family protein [Xanthobacteraceae bacterium]|nr:sulfite exporter TauE/SafE family protein [Xanthobacteraceae bacterium]